MLYNNPDAQDLALSLLKVEADPLFLENIQSLVTQGSAGWAFDPYVPDVVGLINGDNRALVVVYLNDEDFEVGLDLEQYNF